MHECIEDLIVNIHQGLIFHSTTEYIYIYIYIYTYMSVCEDTGCCPEDLPEAMNDREKWRERVRDIRATSTTWWWWWYRIFSYMSLFYTWNRGNITNSFHVIASLLGRNELKNFQNILFGVSHCVNAKDWITFYFITQHVYLFLTRLKLLFN